MRHIANLGTRAPNAILYPARLLVTYRNRSVPSGLPNLLEATEAAEGVVWN
jgi:hypothetical protein